MSPSISLLAGLLAIQTPPSAAGPPSVRATGSASHSWAIVHRAQVWVCWDPGPDCWVRIVVDEGPQRGASDDVGDSGEAEPSDLDSTGSTTPRRGAGWRLGFSGPRTLWMSTNDHLYRIERGRSRALETQGPPMTALDRPTPAACGPQGRVPQILSGGVPGWTLAPRCGAPPPALSCRSRAALGTLRAPVPVQIRLGVEVSASYGWTARAELEGGPASETRVRGDMALIVFVELGLDALRFSRARRERAALVARDRSRRTLLPARSLRPEDASVSGTALCEVSP